MIKNIIFDFDGTLVDTSPVILQTMRATISEMGLPQLSEKEYRATIGLRLAEIPAALYPEKTGLSDTYVETYTRLFWQFNRPDANIPYPFMAETLKKLSEMGVGMAIASSRGKASLVAFLEQTGVRELIALVVGGEDVKEGKPSPEAVFTILSRLGWEAEATIVVGDTTFDLDMARAAGIRSCGVTYGNHTRSQLLSSGPAWVVDSLPELVRLIELNH